MPQLLLGPLLRYVGETDAVVWVETAGPCEVEVLGARERTFCVCGHHYALVHPDGLEPGTDYEYEVRLDGERVWPLAGLGVPAERLPARFRRRGRCGSRSAPAAWPRRTSPPGPCARTRTTAAARSTPCETSPCGCASRADRGVARPAADARRPGVRGRGLPGAPPRSPSRAATPTSRPGERVLDYEEYARLYRESWSEPVIRWLLSTVPTAMIFDDHDVHDDWNISAPGWRRCTQTDWWDEHIVAALMSYWVYQHLGNLEPGGPARLRAAPAGQGGRRRRRDPARVRARAERQTGRLALELLPRRGRHADRGRGLARRPRAGGGQALDGRRGRVGLDHRARHRRLRPPADRHVAAVPARPRHALRGGLERGRGRRRVGPAGRAAGRSGCRRSVDLEHWAAFQSVVRRASASSSERWAPASAASRRPRS